jgi:hypothetical protein
MRFSDLALIIGMIIAYPMMVTVLHEIGHASSATLLGYEVRSIWFGLDGSSAFVHIQGPFNALDYDVILLSGGFAVALFFVAIAILINKQFVLIAPFHLTYGVYEMAGPIPHFVGALIVISWLAFMAIIVNWSIRKEVIEW